MVSSAATGQYRAAYPIAVTVTAALSAFSFLLLPQVSELHHEGSYTRVRDAYSTVSKWTLLTAFPVSVTMVLFPQELVTLTFGPEYTQGANVLPILAVGLGIHVALGPNKDTLTAIGKVDFIMLMMIVSAVMNLLLNFLLIPIYGIFGAAVATTLTYSFLNVGLSVRLYTLHKITPFSKRAIRTIIFSSISIVIVWSTGNYLFTNDTGSLVTSVILFGVVHLLIVMKHGLTPIEIDETEETLHKLSDRTDHIVTFLRKINNS
jgi:O-antigen/teichoic acid export membrane protein